jgi:1,4-dihydroxy-6-naphthoate synthase
MNLVMRDSVAHALENPGDSMDFVRLHAQEMDEAVMREHIGLYVNDFTLDLGPRGHSALDILEKRAAAAGLIAQGAAG